MQQCFKPELLWHLMTQKRLKQSLQCNLVSCMFCMTVVAVWDIEDVCYINIDPEKMICSAFAKDFDLFLSFSKVCHGVALWFMAVKYVNTDMQIPLGQSRSRGCDTCRCKGRCSQFAAWEWIKQDACVVFVGDSISSWLPTPCSWVSGMVCVCVGGGGRGQGNSPTVLNRNQLAWWMCG